MTTRMSGWLLGASALAAAAIAACGEDPGSLSGGARPIVGPGERGEQAEPPSGGASGGGAAKASPGVANADAKSVFLNEVFPTLSNSCGGCHGDGGSAPAWLPAQPESAYSAIEAWTGLLARDSPILTKGIHGGGAAPALTADQILKVTRWIDLDLRARGDQAPAGILSKLGSCMDPVAFEAVGVQGLRTIRRQNENANNCTGCNNAYCSVCHTADPATKVYIHDPASTALPKNYTFEKAKAEGIGLYFATNGATVVASNKLQLKAAATKKDKPYTHPMFEVDDVFLYRLNAFVQDTKTRCNLP